MNGSIWQPLILNALVLERPVLKPFAEEMARSPVLQSAFEELLRDPDAAEFHGTAGQSGAQRTSSMYCLLASALLTPIALRMDAAGPSGCAGRP